MKHTVYNFVFVRVPLLRVLSKESIYVRQVLIT